MMQHAKHSIPYPSLIPTLRLRTVSARVVEARLTPPPSVDACDRLALVGVMGPALLSLCLVVWEAKGGAPGLTRCCTNKAHPCLRYVYSTGPPS
jgi:hypothetical protein